MSLFRGLGVDISRAENDLSQIIERCPELNFTPLKVKSAWVEPEDEFTKPGVMYTGEYRIVNPLNNEVIDGGHPVSTNYKPHDVKAILQSLCEIATLGDLTLSNAAVLRGGEHIVLQASSKSSFSPVVGDIYGGNVLFKISNVPGITSSVSAYVLRLVCTNGATARENVGDGILTLHHRREYDGAARESVEKMTLALESSLSAYKGKMDMLYYTPVDRVETRAYMSRVLEIGEDEESRSYEALREAIGRQPGVTLTNTFDIDEHTFATLYNGVTYWVDHVRGRKPETALFSSIYGEGERLKRRALKVALEMIVEGRN